MASSDSDALDPSRFRRVTRVAALRVPLKSIDAVVKSVRRSGFLLDISRVRPCVKDASSDAHRLVLLNPEKVAPGTEALPDALCGDAMSGVTLSSHELETGYEHLTAEEILRQVIPAAITAEIPSSFETVGHIAHLNLRDELLPYRQSIGRVLLTKNSALRTVVNKTGTIETQFRTFPMEVIAGDDDTVVEVRRDAQSVAGCVARHATLLRPPPCQVKHCGATFRFDFRTVYWNSRLQHEHELLVTQHIPAGAVVADVFCGVGPFAVPLALDPRACVVHANDLNPASHAALLANVAANRVGGRVRCYNEDGRDFIRRLVRARVPFTHAVMNLPADALSFLDAFVGLYGEGGSGAGSVVEGVPEAATATTGTAGVKRRREDAEAGDGSVESAGAADAAAVPTHVPAPVLSPLPLPRIHVYCFTKAETPEEWTADVVQRAGAALGLLPAVGGAAASAACDAAAAAAPLPEQLLPGLLIRRVRDVAPKKLMLCVSFDLPPAAAYALGPRGGVTAADGPGENQA